MTNRVSTPPGLDERITGALERLRTAADSAERCWFPERWSWRCGTASGEVRLRPVDSFVLSGGLSFDGLSYTPGSPIALTARFDPPKKVAGVSIAGEPLQLSLNTLYPATVEAGGRQVFADRLPPVACGPALFEALPSISPGSGQELRITFRPPENQTVPHSELAFTTPGLWRRFLALDTAWAQLVLAASLAVEDVERRTVLAAAAAVPAEPLGLDQAALEAVLADVAAALLPVAPRVAQRSVHAIGHSHIDLQWLWTWEDTAQVIKRDVASVLALMDEFPEMHFTHSQPATYELLRREEPALFDRVNQRVAEGRWEPATMQWVECDVNLVSGEAQARQLLEGVSFTRQHLGCSPHVHLAPDTFGHVGNLPQLASSAGASVYYHHRGNPGQASGGALWPAYWWVGDDGTRILALSSPVYLGPVTPGRVAQDVLALTSENGLKSCVYFFGVGDHGGGPTRRDLETLRQMATTSGLPSIACSTLAGFADDVMASGVALPEHRGESPTVFEGCYTSQADVKWYNRAVESELVAADTLCALAGRDELAELGELWRAALFHQFHDIICGSAIAEARDRSVSELERVLEAARTVTAGAVEALTRELPQGSIAVVNPLGCHREDVVVVPELSGEGAAIVLDERGGAIPAQRGPDGLRFVASLPPFGTAAYRLTGSPDAEEPRGAPALCIGESGARFFTVDTPFFFAMVRRDSGILTTLYDKGAGRELVGYNIARGLNYEQVRPDLGLGVLQVFDERPHGMSSWVIDEVYAEHSLIDGAEVRITESGPVRVVLESTHVVRASRIVKRVVFYAALARIDIELEVSWNERGGPDIGVPNLGLSFAIREPVTEVTYETPFGASRRAADGLVVPGQRWAHLGGREYGVAVLNDSKYGFDALGSRLRVHVVRTSYEPDTESDAGSLTRCRLGIVPRPGSWRDARLGELGAAFNTPLRARLIGTRAGREVGARTPWRPHLVEATGVVIDAVKLAAGGGGERVVRLHESTGRFERVRLAGLPHGTGFWLANIVEDVVAPLDATPGPDGDLRVDLAFRPFEVKTVIVGLPANML